MPQHFGTLVTSDRKRIRYGIWPTPGNRPRAGVVLLNGRAEFMEKYAETIGELGASGFDVFSMDWRGQGLSSRDLPDRRKGFVVSYDHYLRDLRQLMDDVVLPRGCRQLVFLAHSMGAHIALRYLHDHPGQVRTAVLVSPMIDILTFEPLRLLVRNLTHAAVRVGWARRTPFGASWHRRHHRRFVTNRLTSDPVRFQVEKQAIAANPALAVGNVTYGWLSATFASIDHIRQPGYPEAIETPVRVLTAEREQIVSPDAQGAMCRRMPNCRQSVIPGARHEIFMETDAIRGVLWRCFHRQVDRFLSDPGG